MHKNRGIAIALSIFIGGLGIHRFYVGQIGRGFLYLLFCWTFIPTAISIIDALVWAFMSNEKFSKLYD